MTRILFFSYPKCSTCRKASKWLDQNNIDYEFFDIVKMPPRKEFLELALKQFSSDKKKLFNTRGKSFKLIDYDIQTLNDKKIIELLLKDGKLIKRPFLILNEMQVILGFNEDRYKEHFK